MSLGQRVHRGLRRGCSGIASSRRRRLYVTSLGLTQQPLLAIAFLLALFCGLLFVGRLLFQPTEADAGTQSELDSFLNEWETQLSTTSPGFYEGQRRGFAVGGAADLRFPTRRFTPFTLSLPSLKSGCGGISFFGGAFSYINGEQFTQFLQNIAQNAVGVAFDMALRTLCPQCATVLSNMENIVRSMTGNLAGSCRAAKALVGRAAALGNLNEIARDNCTSINTALGVAEDTWGGAFKCKDDSELKAVDLRAAANDALNPAQTPTRISQNVFWSAYSNLQGLNPFWDADHGEYLMSLFGTLIVRYDGDATTPTSKVVRPSEFEVDQLLGGWAEGQRKILRCTDGTVSCLDVQAQDAPAFMGFEQQIDDKLTKFAAQLETRQRANPEPILQTNVASMPIVRLLTMVNGVPGGQQYVISTAKRTIAVNLVHAMIKESLKLIRAEISRINDTGLTQEYLDQLQERSTEIDRRIAKHLTDMSTANSNLRVILEMAREAQGQGSPSLMGNLGFAARNANPLTAR